MPYNGKLFDFIYGNKKNMKKEIQKPEILKNCPFCEYKGELNLGFQKKAKIVKGKIRNMRWWRYECPECKNGFTTGKSDEISLNQIK